MHSDDQRKIFVLCAFLVLLGNLLLLGEQSFVGVKGDAFHVVWTDGSNFQTLFTSVQQAINDAENGSVVHVPAGVYNEHVTVNKSISLVGEDFHTTIIDGNNGGTVLQVLADNVSISGFTIRYSGWGWTNNGIYVYSANNCQLRDNYLFINCHNIRLNCSQGSIVADNIIDGNGYGIRFINSENCTAIGNSVSNCIGGVHLENATNCTVTKNYFTQNNQGIRFYSPCTHNRVFENLVFNNSYEGMIELMPGNTTLSNNFVFHNNFVNNTQPFIYKTYGTFWDDGYPSGGNYWSMYNGSDSQSGPYQNETGSDGIGDTPYSINAYDVDRFPLMQPYGSVLNLDTNLTYLTIQDAIDASETLDGDTIFVKSGVYNEHVTVNKTLSLVGEDRNTTIIDGGATGTVVTVEANNVTIAKFTVRNSGSNYPPYGNDCGILLDHCNSCSLSQVQMTDNRIGISLFFSPDAVIEDSLVCYNHEDGIWLWYSGNTTLRENSMSNNKYNFGVFGDSFSDFNNSIDSSNLVDEKPIKYVIGARDEVFDTRTDIGVVYLVNCLNVTVRDLNLTRNGHGVFCYNVTQSEIKNVTTIDNNYGICIQDSTNITAIDNQGLNDWVAICLQNSSNVVVVGNTVSGAEKALSLYESSGNSIVGNTLSESLYGIRLFDSNMNTVFHNNIINNDEQADVINSYENTWDNGLEGNFWSDYAQSDTNKDGLGDSPYAINGSDSDQFPLMGIFHSFRIDPEDNSCVTLVTNSSLLSFSFDNQSRTITLVVEGSNDTSGFCRMSIPESVIEPTVEVVIDGGLTQVLDANYSLHNDGSNAWIYFAFHHSSHEITVIPEYRPLVFCLAVISPAVCCLLLKKRRVRKQPKMSDSGKGKD
jgi:parallel beta-helix repeat protein